MAQSASFKRRMYKKRKCIHFQIFDQKQPLFALFFERWSKSFSVAQSFRFFLMRAARSEFFGIARRLSKARARVFE